MNQTKQNRKIFINIDGTRGMASSNPPKPKTGTPASPPPNQPIVPEK